LLELLLLPPLDLRPALLLDPELDALFLDPVPLGLVGIALSLSAGFNNRRGATFLRLFAARPKAGRMFYYCSP